MNNNKKDSKLIIQAGNILIAIVLFFNLKLFLELYSALVNLNNPLIPEKLFFQINEQRILKGLSIASGLIFIFIFKLLNFHRLLIAVAALLIIIAIMI